VDDLPRLVRAATVRSQRGQVIVDDVLGLMRSTQDAVLESQRMLAESEKVLASIRKPSEPPLLSAPLLTPPEIQHIAAAITQKTGKFAFVFDAEHPIPMLVPSSSKIQ
jgi:hypothetical protein